MTHEPEVIEHITSAGEVSADSVIRYFARCECGWKGPQHDILIMAQTDAIMHRAAPWTSRP